MIKFRRKAGAKSRPPPFFTDKERRKFMTVTKLFKTALSLCGESNTAPYLADFALDWANTLMAEYFETEQSLRRESGAKELGTVPVLKLSDEEIPYDPRLVNGVFVLAFAAFICDICDDRELASIFRAQSRSAAETAAKAHEYAIFDAYAEEAVI